jgi:hypothetical protein
MATQEASPQPAWELSEAERRALARAGMIDEDEHFVMTKISLGRQLLRLDMEGSADFLSPDLAPGVSGAEDCNYYDAIASLLFPAAQDGFGPEELCEDAVEQYRSFTQTARAQVARRIPNGS